MFNNNNNTNMFTYFRDLIDINNSFHIWAFSISQVRLFVSFNIVQHQIPVARQTDPEVTQTTPST